MIRFCCEQCGHNIRVPDQGAGKRGKCPKCGNNVIVPDKSTTLVLKCGNCGLKISIPRTHAGQKGRCPKCKNPIVVPAEKSPVRKPEQIDPDDTARLVGNDIGLTLLDVPEELKLKDEPVVKSGITEAVFEHRLNIEKQLVEDERCESADRGKLRWPINLLLYPVSQGGLCTIGVVVVLKFLIDIATILLVCCTCAGGILGFIIRILIVYSYMYWYFSECIRDSADGGLRAPEIIGSMPGLGDMVCQFFRLFACYAFFLGPLTFYWGYTFFNKIEMDGIIFWSLLTYGIFFFPIGMLAVVMFGSTNGLNPVLLIRSIFSVLVRYCLLVLLFYGLGILFVLSRITMASILPKGGIIASIISSYIPFAFSMYALLIFGHILGRFYWRYQDKLNWEV